MPNRDVEISISSNNSAIETFLLDDSQLPEIKFVKENKLCVYRVFLIDLSHDLSNISQSLINQYGLCRENTAKLLAIILHEDSIDIEKNHYFQKMLDDLGKDKPLHRLVFTKDLYQKTSSNPITPLDKYIYESVTSNDINISEKGENLLFPLSISDFIKALTKTLFLTNTSGQSFWILGDPLSDLEFAYLIKKNDVSNEKESSDINASKKNDPKTNSLLSVGNKSRGELSWNPEDEIYDDLKQIIGLYSKNTNTEETKTAKLNPLHKIILWLYKPRQKKETKLPTVKKIIIKIITTLVVFVIIIGGIAVIATSLSLKQLESSLKQTLNGNIKDSVQSLQSSVKLKEIGESTFSTITPLANLISPKDTEKIYNLFSFIDYSSSSLGNLHQTYVMAEGFLSSISNSESKTNYSDLSLALHSNLSQIYENLNQITLLSNNNRLPSFLNNKIKENSQYQNLQALEEQIIQFIKISDVIPSIFTSEASKNILVLLQNSQISKPGGGEIDHLLMITLNNGKLINKKYYTTQEIDTLLQASASATTKSKKTTTVQPKIQELAQNPNFPSTANEIALRLEKTINIKPDFVIATNELLVKQLLEEEKSGSIDQFNKDFLTTSGAIVYREITDQYINRLFKNEISIPVIGRTLAKMVGENQILIWSSSPIVQKQLSSQSYSGVISPHLCNASIGSGTSCMAQTNYLSESMINNSRKSPWKERQITHTQDISIFIKHEYQIVYHTDDPQASSSAIITTFDLYQSSPSSFDQILQNDLPSSMKELKKTQEGNLDHYQITLSLLPNQDNTIVFKTTTFSNNPSTPNYSYSLTEYRQPGMKDLGINQIIIYPKNLRPSVVTSSFTALPEKMTLTLPPRTSTFGFTFEQNTQ